MATTLPQDPIFIVGYPRSGTTLLQALLATQGGIRTLPETHFFSMVLRRLGGSPLDRLTGDSLAGAWAVIREKTGVVFPDSVRAEMEADAREARLSAKDLFERLVGHLLGTHGGDRSADDSFCWLEKTPNHAYFLDQIFTCYPKCRVVNIVRHPVAAVLSRRKSFPFNARTPLRDLAAQWVRSIRAAEAFAAHHPGTIHSIRYEDLVADPEGVMSRIGEFLGLGLDVAALVEYRTVAERVIQPGESWKQGVREPLRNTNEAYLRGAAMRDVMPIQAEAGGEMTRLGYPLRHPRLQRWYNWLHPQTRPGIPPPEGRFPGKGE